MTTLHKTNSSVIGKGEWREWRAGAGRYVSVGCPQCGKGFDSRRRHAGG